MNCNDYTEKISAYIDNVLSSDEMQSVRAHINSCEKCAVKYRAMSSLSEISASLSEVKVPDCLISRVMDNLDTSDVHPKIKRFILPSWVTDWRIYSSLAACVLAVFIVRTGIDEKYSSFHEENYNYTYENKANDKKDIQNAYSTASALTEETAAPSDQNKKTAPAYVPEETSVTTDDAAQAAPQAEADLSVAAAVPTGTPAITARVLNERFLLSDTEVDSSNADSVPAPASAGSEAAAFNAWNENDKGTEKGEDADTNTLTTYSSKARSGGYSPDETSSVSSAGGSISSHKKSLDSSYDFNAAKEAVLSKYTFSEKSSMLKKSVTFVITNNSDSAKATELFYANASGGEAAVQRALSAAGINYTRREAVMTDYTSAYNALVTKGNALKSQVSSATIPSALSTLDDKLSSVQNELSEISNNCSTVELILN